MTDLFPGGAFDTSSQVSTTDDVLSFFFENDLPFSPDSHSAADTALHSPHSPLPLFSQLYDPLIGDSGSPTLPEFETEVLPELDFSDAEFSRPIPSVTTLPSSPPAMQSPQFSSSPQPHQPQQQAHYHSPHSSAHSPQFEWAKSTAEPASPSVADDQTSKSATQSRPKRERANSNEGSSPSKVPLNVEGLSELGTGVTLPRHVLIKITSEEFEAYATHLAQIRQLTDEEQKELRRQRRMIKNREYAQENRTKKKKASMTTHQQVTELEKENQVLRSENAVLKQEIIRLRTMLSEVAYNNAEVKLGTILTPPSTATSQRPAPAFWDYLSIGSLRSQASIKATAACLFVVLFSFALFNVGPTTHVGTDQRSSARVLLDLSQSAVDVADGFSSWFCSFSYVSDTSWCRTHTPPDLSRSHNSFAFDESVACQ